MAHHRHPVIRWTFAAITAVIAASLLAYLGIALLIIGAIAVIIAAWRSR